MLLGILVEMDMDDSMSSTNYLSKFSNDDSSEESGWTSYIDDFISQNSEMEDYQSSSSMVSASASLSMRDKVMSKKRKGEASIADHELDDTASSPVHCPTVHDLKHLYMHSKAMDDRDLCKAYELNHNHNKEQKRANSTGFNQENEHISMKVVEDINMAFLETELRRKGLCLVPMSMLLNVS